MLVQRRKPLNSATPSSKVSSSGRLSTTSSSSIAGQSKDNKETPGRTKMTPSASSSRMDGEKPMLEGPSTPTKEIVEDIPDLPPSPDRVQKFVDAVDQFIWNTFQWKQPNVSVLYVLLVNVSFWLSVFYLPRENQLYALFTVAGFIICLETFYVARILPSAIRHYYIDAKMGFAELRAAEDHSAKLRYLVPAIVTARPVRFLLRPLTAEAWRLFRFKTDHVLISSLCLWAARSLELDSLEQAGWSAYTAVLTLLIAPAWRANGVTWIIRDAIVATAVWLYTTVVLCITTLVHVIVRSIQIVYNLILTFLCTTRDLIKNLLLFIYNTIVATVIFIRDTVVAISTAVYRFACFLLDWITYIVLLKWVPPLVAFVVSQLERLYTWLNTTVVQPIYSVLYKVFVAVRYVVCGYWVPPLYRAIRDFILGWVEYITSRVRAFCTYCSDTYTATTTYLVEKKESTVTRTCAAYDKTKSWIRQQWLMPIGEHYNQLKALTIYIFCGHWISPLVSWWHAAFVQPCVNALVYLKARALYYAEQTRILCVYIFCGYWVLDLYQIAAVKATIFKDRINESAVRPTVIWVDRKWNHTKQTCAEVRDYSIEQYRRAVSYTRQQLLAFKIWLIESIKSACASIAHFLFHSVLVPTLVALVDQTKKAMVYSNDNVLKPLLHQFKLATSELCVLWHQNVIVPLWLYIEVHMKRLKHHVWIQYVQPSCIWLQHKLPDPGDAELKEFYPEEADGTGNSATRNWSSSRQSIDDDHTGFTPAMTSKSHSRRDSRDLSPEDEDSDEFTSGLRFTGRAVMVDSDSSDEEFSLRHVVKHKRVLPEAVRKPVRTIHAGVQKRDLTPDGQWSDEEGSISSHTDSLSLVSSIRDSVAEDPPSVSSKSSVLVETCHPSRPSLASLNANLSRPTSSSQSGRRPEGQGQPSRAQIRREDRDDDPPSTASNPPSWSDTLLQAYKKTGHKTPSPRKTAVPEESRKTSKDDEFELLDADGED